MVLFAAAASALAGCGLGDPCSEIKSKLASCGQPVPSEGQCSSSMLASYDMLMSVDCLALAGDAGKADWFWSCDPGRHRCGYLCCDGKSPIQKIKDVIASHANTPYVDMGERGLACTQASWATGMDCSCFVQQTFKEALDIDIPRDSLMQYEAADWTFTSKKPGDLLFFFFPGRWKPLQRRTWDEFMNWLFDAASHVGIYLGRDEAGQRIFAHMSKAKGRINILPLDPFIEIVEESGGEYKGARRVLDYMDVIGYE